VIGGFVDIAGQPTRIAGVVDLELLHLPGHVDAWILEDEEHLALSSQGSAGFVLALPRTTLPRTEARQSMTVRDETRGDQRFDCIPLAEQDHVPLSILVFTFVIALMAVPATTPLQLGEYPRHTMRSSWTERTRRWFFLWSKLLLLAPLVHFTAMDAAYGHTQSVVTSQYIQLSLSFFGFLFGLRWILEDQRRRCPVCLRVLSNPARVGEASRNFLAWNGTELICVGGHGLLHIPGHPTSWFGTQRWLALDASWRTLFTDSYAPSAGLL
jgi:hypothetical protein